MTLNDCLNGLCHVLRAFAPPQDFTPAAVHYAIVGNMSELDKVIPYTDEDIDITNFTKFWSNDLNELPPIIDDITSRLARAGKDFSRDQWEAGLDTLNCMHQIASKVSTRVNSGMSVAEKRLTESLGRFGAVFAALCLYFHPNELPAELPAIACLLNNVQSHLVNLSNLSDTSFMDQMDVILYRHLLDSYYTHNTFEIAMLSRLQESPADQIGTFCLTPTARWSLILGNDEWATHEIMKSLYECDMMEYEAIKELVFTRDVIRQHFYEGHKECRAVVQDYVCQRFGQQYHLVSEALEYATQLVSTPAAACHLADAQMDVDSVQVTTSPRSSTADSLASSFGSSVSSSGSSVSAISSAPSLWSSAGTDTKVPAIVPSPQAANPDVLPVVAPPVPSSQAPAAALALAPGPAPGPPTAVPNPFTTWDLDRHITEASSEASFISAVTTLTPSASFPAEKWLPWAHAYCKYLGSSLTAPEFARLVSERATILSEIRAMEGVLSSKTLGSAHEKTVVMLQSAAKIVERVGSGGRAFGNVKWSKAIVRDAEAVVANLP